ncbi:(2Fe-2S) ferredoxin domain-containing protein [Rhodoferax sp. U2-2l]|uniref:(2Fe-2S) ferredoxin domain-containing protein n=1 Tax=Rhodoferax sp. U2-2l TaxID=2884000 RepID=UPI001D0BD705|nr:(2Fe-2S) ferredoxin domain-containing protein [Rhodoferax sp. U2-2l]MCB8746175.1 (2Fe-2S) ferredoxin domain-containing protein [Rhodoferax sp. U2-2l]
MTHSTLPVSGSSPPAPAAGYFQRHIFFCINERPNGESCCAQHGALAAFDHCKAQVKAAGLAGPGQVRVNKAGCLDRCAAGPVAVVYPEGVWYSYLDNSDIDEIVESHLKNGQVVQRLLTPPHLGR